MYIFSLEHHSVTGIEIQINKIVQFIFTSGDRLILATLLNYTVCNTLMPKLQLLYAVMRQ